MYYKIYAKKIEVKGSREIYSADLWKLPKNISEENGYIYSQDILDYFSKFIMSYPLETKMKSIHLIQSSNFVC